MGIPNKLSPVTGGGGILPRGYLSAEFLESTGTQVIQTGIIPTTKTGFRCKVQETTAPGMQCWYCGCQTSTNGYWLTSRGQNGGKLSIQVGSNGAGLIAIEDNATDMNAVEAACNFYNSGTAGRLDNQSKINMSGEWTRDFTLFKAAYGTGNEYDPTLPMRIFYFYLTEGDELVRDFIPVLDPDGVPVMYDNVNKAAFTNSGSGQFIVGMTPVQARQLGKLPVVESGTLTVSLPWEAQWDAGVQNALDIAAKKRWTITVQYRDPEIATTNIPISFLESTGEQYINTNVVPDSTIEFDMQIAYTTPLKETIGYKPYFGCIGRDSYGNFRLAHSSNVTESNDFEAFVMESFYWFRYTADAIEARKIYRLQTALTPLSGTTPAVSMDGAPMTFISRSAGSYQYTGSITTPIGLFGRIGFGEITSKGTPFIVKSAHLIKNGTSAFNAVGVLDSTGIPCMYDRVTDQLVYNSGTGTFIAGFDTVAQARHIAHLPDVTAETDAAKKSLTVSLPWEAQLVITGVPAALQVAADRGWMITVQYRDPEIDNIYYNKYATCTKQADMEAVNAKYKADLTADGKWIYPLPKLADGNQIFNSAQISEVDIEELPLVSSGYFMFANNKAIKRFTTRMPKMNWFDRTFHNTSLEVFDYDGEEFSPGSLQLGFNSCKNFRTFNAVLGKKIVNATAAFSECILDKPSILRIANSAIPSSSGIAFTIGMHIDLQNDTEVLDALELMRTNGWSLIPQWNGTATASTVSTFGLRSQSIYAKPITIELPDATTETILDWGHYFANWEDLGYMEFTSVEEAKEYFNINQPEEV